MLKDQQGIVHILALLILLGGIIGGVSLVTAGPLKFFPKASSGSISGPINITTLSVTPTSGHIGDRLAIAGSNYKPKTAIYLVWGEGKVFIPTKRTSANGSINVSFQIPAGSTPGQYTLRATVNGVSSPTVNIQVFSSTPSSYTYPTPYSTPAYLTPAYGTPGYGTPPPYLTPS